MIKIIVGNKGSGKTKRLIESINARAEDYEIINPDKFFNDFENCRMKITGKIITVDNVKKIYAEYIEFEIPNIY